MIRSVRKRDDGGLVLCAEVGALGGVLTRESTQEHTAALLSVKSIYGHTEGTAGKRQQISKISLAIYVICAAPLVTKVPCFP